MARSVPVRADPQCSVGERCRATQTGTDPAPAGGIASPATSPPATRAPDKDASDKVLWKRLAERQNGTGLRAGRSSIPDVAPLQRPRRKGG